MTRSTPTRRSRRHEVPRPFLKWAGGKTQLLGALVERLPSRFDRYFEPFCGGAALFFKLQPEHAILSDSNPELVNCYRVVREQVDELILALGRHRYDRDHYYEVRELSPSDLPPVERAARTIFLNRTGYNGLYRVNRRGQFNVPFGRYKNPKILDEENLRACSRALGKAKILEGDFEEVAADARRGDIVYFDPPYVPMSRTSDFTAYVQAGFGTEDQARLARLFSALAERDVAVVLSNSDVESVRALYRGFRIDTVSASRSINSRGEKRGKVAEVVVSHVGDERETRTGDPARTVAGG